MVRRRIIKYSGGKIIRIPHKKRLFNKNYIFVFFFSFFFLFGLTLNFLIPSIKIKGGSSIDINYREKYKEKGYKASFLGRDLTKKVKVSGSVNSNKLGEYKIVYEVRGIFKRKVVRKVRVVDKSAPSITLSSFDDIYVCPDSTYKTDKYSAFDNYDKDITDKVKIVYKKDKVIYSVIDSSGNKTKVSRNIIYKDNSAPNIELIGSDVVYLFLNDEYKDEGVKVIDDCDGDITFNVETSGRVDTSKTGDYTIVYKAVDKAGNKAEVKRKIVVSEKGANGSIYLTFDDGPKSGTTDVILDILKEEGVKATFFVTNSGADELIKRAYDEGHSIALHTASHDYSLVYKSVDDYFYDLKVVGDRVKRITGEESKIIRFPGGSSNTISRRYSDGIMSILTKEVVERGYRYYDWNLSSGDAAGGSPSKEDIYNNVVNGLRKDRVNMILMHDIKTYTRDALRDIIKYGKDNGYVFDKIVYGTEMITQRVNN